MRTYITEPHLYFVLLFSLPVLTINSCKDECSKVTTRYDITPALKDFYFKKGTYWVYEDTANHVMDSQYVYADTSGYQSGSTRAKDGSYCSVGYEFFRTFVMHTLNGGLDSFQYWDVAIQWKGAEYLSLGNTELGGSSPVLWLEKPIGPIQSNITYNGIVYQKINGVNYNNIYWYSAIIGTGIGVDYLKYNTDYYFVPKIGVVKKVEFGTPNGTKVWELKKYFVQQ